MPKGILYGVGVGPGDPELLTLKAVKVLQSADLVCIPLSQREKESAAYSIAREHLPENCAVFPLLFPMTRDKDDLERSWEEACAEVQKHLDKGIRVVFLTIGDPMLYSTYIYLFKRLQADGYTVQTIPGVPSFCAAASAAGFPLGEGDGKIAIIPWGPDAAGSPEYLKQFESLVIMKVSHNFTAILDTLAQAGFLGDSVLVSKCGYEDEEIRRDLSSFSDNKEDGREIPYFSLILARKEKE